MKKSKYLIFLICIISLFIIGCSSNKSIYNESYNFSMEENKCYNYCIGFDESVNYGLALADDIIYCDCLDSKNHTFNWIDIKDIGTEHEEKFRKMRE